MICARHDWWKAAVCPRCHALALAHLEASCAPAAAPVPCAETVTAAETSQSDLVSGPVGEPADDGLEIPDFLKRNKDGTLTNPRENTCHDWTPKAERCPEHQEPISTWSDAELYAALDNTELTLIDRQPFYMELRAREDKQKSHARIAAMKEKKANKEA